MKIERLELKNFRCFGPEGSVVELDDLTTLIGGNGCGKTAVLQALMRLFGTTQAQRTIEKGDFFVASPPDDELESGTRLSIDAWIAFPEIDNEHSVAAATIPPCFNHMSVADENQPLQCHIRLEATWTKGNLPDGEVQQSTSWVLPKNDSEEQHLRPLTPDERSQIHLIYVPANRDPAGQLRHTAGTLLHRLFRAMEWSKETQTEIATAFDNIRTSFRSEAGVQAFEKRVSENWGELHKDVLYANPRLQPVASTLDQILKQVGVVFSPSPGGDLAIERLSEGLRSLFYISLVTCIFDLEQETVAAAFSDELEEDAPDENEGVRAFSHERLDAPGLSIFAIEEPENHLAPHFLGRVTKLLQRIADHPTAQVVMTSHSPSIVARIDPEQIRHLRLEPKTRTTVVSRIILPSDNEAAHKFVREAVRAYPELYFARVVVLGEGDSEEVVIPRVAEALGVALDRSLVSVVPLGGRHVQHFWRLLTGLQIPYVTLLDLDRERYGGGWGRVKYVIKQLIERGEPAESLLRVRKGKNCPTGVLPLEDLEAMHNWELDVENLDAWVKKFEEWDVFFSHPLDLDWMMLTSFTKTYQSIVLDSGEAPKAPSGKETEWLQRARKAVLGEAGGDGSTYDDPRLFHLYRLLFYSHSKPATHLSALSRISKRALSKGAPPVLHRLIERVNERMGELPGDLVGDGA